MRKKFYPNVPGPVDRVFFDQKTGDRIRQKTATAGEVNFDDAESGQLAFEQGKQFEADVFRGKNNGQVPMELQDKKDFIETLKKQKNELYVQLNDEKRTTTKLFDDISYFLVECGWREAKKQGLILPHEPLAIKLLDIRASLKEQDKSWGDMKHDWMHKLGLQQESAQKRFGRGEIKKFENLCVQFADFGEAYSAYFQDKVQVAVAKIEILCGEAAQSECEDHEMQKNLKFIWDSVLPFRKEL